MTTQVLIFDVRGPQYRALLAKRFPAVQFHIGHHVWDVEGVIHDTNVIFGLGHHIPPALIAKAKNLKWVEALTKASHKLAEVMYRETQASGQPGPQGAGQAGAPGPGGAQAPKSDVVDAEFEDLGDKGKN